MKNKMNNYKCKFLGRESGALGINSYFELQVEADTVDQALLKLYDTHENIMKYQIVNTSNPKDYKTTAKDSRAVAIS